MRAAGCDVAALKTPVQNGVAYIIGIEVNVPNGLARKPRPAMPPVAALWNFTIPRFPAVSGS